MKLLRILIGVAMLAAGSSPARAQATDVNAYLACRERSHQVIDEFSEPERGRPLSAVYGEVVAACEASLAVVLQWAAVRPQQESWRLYDAYMKLGNLYFLDPSGLGKANTAYTLALTVFPLDSNPKVWRALTKVDLANNNLVLAEKHANAALADAIKETKASLAAGSILSNEDAFDTCARSIRQAKWLLVQVYVERNQLDRVLPLYEEDIRCEKVSIDFQIRRELAKPRGRSYVGFDTWSALRKRWGPFLQALTKSGREPESLQLAHKREQSRAALKERVTAADLEVVGQ